MDVKLIRYTPEPDALCGLAAGICVGKEGSYHGLVSALQSGHESVAEHASFTFLIDRVSRVLLAQLTRHRIASFSVLSQRYYIISDDGFIMPTTISDSKIWDKAMEFVADARDLYDELIDNGVPAEDARYIMPQGIETRLMVTMNARELRHFFELRCCNRAQKEIRQLADEMLRQCKEVAPSCSQTAALDA